MRKWIGVDFDQTLRRKDGTPILPMVNRVKRWLNQNIEVRIVTARLQPRTAGMTCFICGANLCAHDAKDITEQINLWCYMQLGTILPVQWGKSMGMLEFWDDKAVAVRANTGEQLSPSRAEHQWGAKNCEGYCHCSVCGVCDFSDSRAKFPCYIVKESNDSSKR